MPFMRHMNAIQAFVIRGFLYLCCVNGQKNKIMAAPEKKKAEKNAVKTTENTDIQQETEKVSKTWLAFQDAIKDPWFVIVDMKAVLK